MSERNVIQHVPGGKWHRQWWPTEMEGPKRHFLTHVGMFNPDLDQRRPRSEVATADLCRVCYERWSPTTGSEA